MWGTKESYVEKTSQPVTFNKWQSKVSEFFSTLVSRSPIFTIIFEVAGRFKLHHFHSHAFKSCFACHFQFNQACTMIRACSIATSMDHIWFKGKNMIQAQNLKLAESDARGLKLVFRGVAWRCGTFILFLVIVLRLSINEHYFFWPR